MTYIPSPQRTGNKICGDFYPLQKEELIALYQANLINSTAFVHFALRCENPFCDRPITLIIKEFGIAWGIPETSLYRALAKLTELGIIKFNAGKVTITWQFPDLGKNETPNSQLWESIPIIGKKFPDVGIHSHNWENRPLETVPGNDPTTPQTLQIDQIPQTRAEEDQKNFSQLEEILGKENITNSTGNAPMLAPIPEQESVPRVVSQVTHCSNLAPEISARLSDFNIPLDNAITKAIATHHPSQIWGAIRHIENTWETIENPRAIFLYQVPKQPIEKPLKEPLTPEFLEWYRSAIANGTVKDISPETLPINQFREPKVYLPDNRLEDWQKVAAGECEELANSEQMADFFKKAREGLRNAAAKK